jgi:hypothetical protein
VFVALVVIVGALFWAVNSITPSSYAGTDLNFVVGAGAVTVTNPSDVPVPVQLVSPGTRTFSVVSTITGVSGTSTTQGTGSDRAQLFEFAPPSGVSEFTVTRGTNVSLVANTDTKLDVNVQPLTETAVRTTLIAAGIVILGTLYYISRTTGHRWIARLRQQALPVPVAQPIVASAAAGQGPEVRAYGDNRANIVNP